MTVLAIDRSAGVLSAAVAIDGAVADAMECGSDFARKEDWLREVAGFARSAAAFPADVYVAGLGPGSFSGIRAVLAAMHGLALPLGAKVCGLPSPYAYTSEKGLSAVIGDARRGLCWSVVFDGVEKVLDFALASAAETVRRIPADCAVFSPDADRLGPALSEAFPGRFSPGPPNARRLAEIAVVHPDLLSRNPLPVYLTPAVRPPEMPQHQTNAKHTGD